jgi:hypothetical protein
MGLMGRGSMMSLRSFGAAAVVAASVFAAAPSAMASAAAPAARLASPAGTRAAAQPNVGAFQWPRPTDRNIYICQSSNYKSLLVWQTDGNLVDYDETGRARWSSRTDGRGEAVSFTQTGYLTVYDNVGPTWSDGAFGYNSSLQCQTDGNVVIYSNGVATWSTRTAH